MVHWSAGEVERLVSLLREGLTDGQIAEEMGKTRNAVLSKRTRMQLPPGSQFRQEHAAPPEPETTPKLILQEKPAYLQTEGRCVVKDCSEPARKGYTNQLCYSHARIQLNSQRTSRC